MGILLSHSSALHEWLERVVVGWPRPPRARLVHAPAYDGDEARKIAKAYGLQPLHVLVSTDSRRRLDESVHTHLWSGSLPPGSAVCVEQDVYLSTPEFLFLQAAWTFDFVDLVRFGFDLCALHTTRTEGGTIKEYENPLTTPGRIAAYLDGATGAPGVKLARLACRCVLGRSRSPRETHLGMSMALGRSKGGQGVSGVELNHVVDLTERQQRVAGKQHYEIDLYVDDAKTGLEYYGREYHEGPVRTASDIRRESILLGELGIDIHGVTKAQSESLEELERFAKVLVTKSGKRWRRPTIEQEHRMRQLLRRLYWLDDDPLRQSPWDVPAI